ncbi:hypothetical protein [Salinisphaera orenii]|uniref:hypothetical protein n=1 Tax=Salinisphaera orenii TaxID=856731 RepID=UPI000DBE15B7
MHYQRGTADTYDNIDRGWRLDLGTNGQRIINQWALIRQKGKVVLTGASTAPSGQLCNPSDTSRLYRLNPYTGGPVANAAFDVNGDGRFTTTDTINSGEAAIYQTTQQGISAGTITMIKANGAKTTLTPHSDETTQTLTTAQGSTAKRITWREIRRGG